MNLFIKVTLAIVLFVVTSYHLYFYITPSLTVINYTEHLISKAKVSLPSSHLNFGSIKHHQENTLYYSLTQDNGSYNYSFNISEEVITGSCGYLTNNEFNKRFVITVKQNNQIDCR
jgi:hypothetical protein